MKKIKVGLAVLAVSILSAGFYSTYVSAINEQWDFEDGKTPPWTPLYANADMKIEEEPNGNKYLRISNRGIKNHNRDYYDVKVANLDNGQDLLQIDYDVMYPEIETEKNGDMQIKYRKGPGSTETTIVARVGKNMSYFRIHNENGTYDAVKDLNMQTLNVVPGHWYSIKLILDLKNSKQTMYVYDKYSGELLSHSTPIGTVGNNNEINMMTFSSGTDMCVDNVKIYEPSCEDIYIYGDPYVESATKNKYFVLGKNSDGSITAPPDSEISWSFEKEQNNVSLDELTSRVIVGSNPEPGFVMLKAEVEGDGKIFTGRKIINVSK